MLYLCNMTGLMNSQMLLPPVCTAIIHIRGGDQLHSFWSPGDQTIAHSGVRMQYDRYRFRINHLTLNNIRPPFLKIRYIYPCQ